MGQILGIDNLPFTGRRSNVGARARGIALSLALLSALLIPVASSQPAAALGPWLQQARLDPLEGSPQWVGTKVALDGNVAAVAGDRFNNFVRVYRRATSGTWQQEALLIPSDGAHAIVSLAVLSDRALDLPEMVIVGRPGSSNPGGAVLVYERDFNGNWFESQMLDPAELDTADSFGWSVNVHRGTLVVGAPNDDDSGPQAGAAYVYENTGSGWERVDKLVPPPGSDDDRFGTDVDVAETTLVAGAPRDDDKGTNMGAAYVYELGATGAWEFATKLTVDDGIGSFGNEVATDEGVVAVAHEVGAVHAFGETGGTWSEEGLLEPTPGSAGSVGFGFSLSASGDGVAVGASSANTRGFQSGSSWVFRRLAGGWDREQEVAPTDGAPGDFYGYDVALDGSTLLGGARSADGSGTDSGGAWVFVDALYAFREDPELPEPPPPPPPPPEFEEVPITVTITEITELGSLDVFDPDFYAKVWVGCQQAITGNPILVTPEVSGEHITPFWTVNATVSTNPLHGMLDNNGDVCVTFEVWDADVFDDQRADANPAPGVAKLGVSVDLETGVWSRGAVWPDNCARGNNAETGVELCFSINLEAMAAIDGVEFTQAIQPYLTLPQVLATLQDGELPIPMIAGKPAVMRVYFDQVESTTRYRINVGHVFERGLALFGDCTPQQRRRNVSTCRSIDYYFTPGLDPTYVPLELHRLVDGNWVLVGVHHFALKKVLTPPMFIRPVTVCDESSLGLGIDPQCGAKSEIVRQIGFFRSSHPGADIKWESSVLAFHEEASFWGDAWNELIMTSMGTIWTLDPTTDRLTWYYGAARPEAPPQPGGGGTGNTAGWLIAISNTSVQRSLTLPTGSTPVTPPVEVAPETIAHEFGHTMVETGFDLGIGHAPSITGCYNTPSDLEEEWPNPGDPTLTTVGFDVANRVVKDQGNFADWMAYCTPRWITLFTYRQVFNVLQQRGFSEGYLPLPIQIAATGSARPVRAVFALEPPQSWIVSGRLDDDTAELEPLYVVDTPAPVDATGSHRLEARSSAGEVLSSAPFSPADVHVEGQHRTAYFAALLPYSPLATTIAVVDPAGTHLRTLSIQGAAPEIAIDPLPPGELEGRHTISWSVTDPDSTNHEALVEYSQDGGNTWQPVTIGAPSGAFVVDFSQFPASDPESQFRVTVSDGVNSARAVSAPFAVGAKPPQAEIFHPLSGTVFKPGDLVWFQAYAFDADDGFLDGESVRWHSDRDGPLGNGDELHVTVLSEGTHRVTVTATDSDGLMAADSMIVVVRDEELDETKIPTTGTVVIIKSTEPAGGSAFVFESDVPGSASFTLDDGQAETMFDLPAGDYFVRETPTPGWSLESLSCRDPDAGSATDPATRTAFIDLDPEETVVCEFVNGEPATGDTPPVADAGGPYAGDEPAIVELDGTASTDDMGIAAFEWDCEDDGTFDSSGAVATATCVYPDDGVYTARLRVTDTTGQTDEDTAVVEIANVAPTTTVDVSDQAAQYSDHIADVTFQGIDVAADAPLTADPRWRMDGGSWQSGLPPGLVLSDSGCNESAQIATCGWVVSGTVGVGSGDYEFGILVGDGDGGEAKATSRIHVSTEDAVAWLVEDSPVLVEVLSDGIGPVAVLVAVQERLPDVAEVAAASGAIELADVLMTLTPMGPGLPLDATCSPMHLVGVGYDAVLTVVCTFGAVPVNVYDVLVVIGGSYYKGVGSGTLIVTDPESADTAGGGWINRANGAEAHDKVAFGFTARHSQGGDQPRGSLVVNRRLSDGSNARLRSTSIAALVSNGSAGWAIVVGEGAYQAPGWAAARHGYTFLAYVESGVQDKFWIRVYDPGGRLVTVLSMEEPAIANAVALEGGHVRVGRPFD